MKKIFTLMLTVCIMLCLVPTHTYAATKVDGGNCGSGVKWALYDTDADSYGDKLVISGKGKMADYEYNGRPWQNDRWDIKTVVIENGVTSVGNSAFYWCNNITSVTLPSSVKTIGDSAFYYCEKLANITLPSALTDIGNGAFHGCKSLKSIKLPSTVKNIGDYAFSYCEKIKTITIPGKVKTIGQGLFSGCTSLTSVKIPEGVTAIGDSAFSNCTSLKSISLPGSLRSVGNYVFGGCTSLKSFTVPGGITEIGYGMFSGCTSLSSVKFHSGVTKIGWDAFKDCTSLKSISLPKNLESIGSEAFENCTGLTTVKIPDKVTSLGGFKGCTSLKSVTLPKNLESIGGNTFEDCKALKSITIPGKVSRIYLSAFKNCTSLTEVIFAPPTDSYPYLYIADSVFEGCKALKNITLPAYTRALGAGVFYGCKALTSMIIPDGIIEIPGNAFENCTALKVVTIPKSVTSIAYRAFYGCKALKNTCYIGSKTEWKKISLASGNDRLKTKMNYNVKPLQIVTQPQNVGIANGKKASVTVEASGDGLTYAWYYKDKTASKFSKTNSFKGANYDLTMNKTRDGRQVYCVITDKYGNSVTTDTATFTLKANTIKIKTQPESVTVKSGTKATVKVSASGTGLKYTWYYKDAKASKFSKTDSFKGTSYSVTMDKSRNGRQVYCLITDKYGNTMKTDVVTLNMEIEPVKITVQPKSVVVDPNGKATVTVTAKGDGLKYAWYYKDTGASKFTKTDSFKTKTYSLSMTAARSGRQVYCVVTDQYGNTATSDVVTLTMKNQALKILGSLDVEYLEKNEYDDVYDIYAADITVDATGEDITYAWYAWTYGEYYDEANDEWTDGLFFKETSCTSKNYRVYFDDIIADLGNVDGTKVYCVVTDKYGDSVKSEEYFVYLDH